MRAISRGSGPSSRLAEDLGFDAGREDLDMAPVGREWERSDELIVSPEDAGRIDLRQHVRDLVAGMERDLGTRLEWVAIDHHHTDDEHVHLLIRGVREDGRTLTLDREQWTEIDRAPPGLFGRPCRQIPSLRGSAR